MESVHGPARCVDEVAGADPFPALPDLEFHFARDHEIRLVPWMLMGRRTGIRGNDVFHERPSVMGVPGTAQKAHSDSEDVEWFTFSCADYGKGRSHCGYSWLAAQPVKQPAKSSHWAEPPITRRSGCEAMKNSPPQSVAG